MRIKNIVFGVLAASLLCGAAAAESKAPTVWTPPKEISGKPATTAPAGAAPSAATTTTVPTDKTGKEAKEQACAVQAKAKGLKKGKKWAYIDECMKK